MQKCPTVLEDFSYKNIRTEELIPGEFSSVDFSKEKADFTGEMSRARRPLCSEMVWAL